MACPSNRPGRKIIAQVDNAGETDLVNFSLNGSASTRVSGLGGTAFGRPYSGASFSLSSDGTVAYTIGSPDKPADIAVLGNGGKPRVLTDLNADVLPYLDMARIEEIKVESSHCLLYTSPSPRDRTRSRMPSSA